MVSWRDGAEGQWRDGAEGHSGGWGWGGGESGGLCDSLLVLDYLKLPSGLSRTPREEQPNPSDNFDRSVVSATPAPRWQEVSECVDVARSLGQPWGADTG